MRALPRLAAVRLRLRTRLPQVVVAPDTIETIDRARDAGKSLWRISSTAFVHVQSDKILQPVDKFADGLTPEAAALYAPMKAGEQVRRELEFINLRKAAAPAAAASTDE